MELAHSGEVDTELHLAGSVFRGVREGRHTTMAMWMDDQARYLAYNLLPQERPLSDEQEADINTLYDYIVQQNRLPTTLRQGRIHLSFMAICATDHGSRLQVTTHVPSTKFLSIFSFERRDSLVLGAMRVGNERTPIGRFATGRILSVAADAPKFMS